MSEQFLAWFNEMLPGLKCDVNSWEVVYGRGGRVGRGGAVHIRKGFLGMLKSQI